MKTRLLIITTISLSFVLFFACTRKDELKIMTVTGEIPASEMGVSLTHEHILVDFIGADSISPSQYVKDSVIVKVTPFLDSLKQFKVNTFVDCTPEFLGRDPLLLKELSEKTGLKILTNTGWYAANNGKQLPHEVTEMSAEELAALWTDEAKNGIANSGVKPGFIKIAINDIQLSDTVKKLIEAAAITHLNTGLTIVSHTGYFEGANAQISLLREKGVDPSALVWAHAMIEPKKENILSVAEAGVWISLDGINNNYASIGRAVYLLKFMKESRRLDRVLLSHDAGWYQPGEPQGGQFRGFTTLFDTLIPLLKLDGFTDEEIDQLLVKNPAEAFAIRVRPNKEM